MPETPLRLHGEPVDHPDWGVEPDDGFDERALEQAMLRARAEAYAGLAELDAA